MKCKSCGVELSPVVADTSIWAMSFVPAGSRKIYRERAIRFAKKIGPLCRRCLAQCKDLRANGPAGTPAA
jgi:hypothetical protein